MSALIQIEKQILDFFNQVKHPSEIVDKIKDDPGFGRSSSRAYGIRKALAEEIIRERKRLGGEFASIDQIDRIRGVGKDTLNDIYYSFLKNPTNYPVVLFPVRLETRFKENKLWLRIYPDDICINSHDKSITLEESDSVDRLKGVLSDPSISSDEKKNSWRGFVAKYGLQRATYLVNLEERVLRNGDLFSPKISVLPSRFLVTIYKDGKPLVHKIGKNIPDVLNLLKSTDSAESEDTLFDENSLWVSDFDKAESVGMAMKIDLKCFEGPIDSVVAVGIRDNMSPQSSAGLVEDLFKSHIYTNGFGFLEYGTPTNNSNTSKSGYSSEQNEYRENSYNSLFAEESHIQINNSNADILSRLLGIKSDIFQGIDLAQDNHEYYSSFIRDAIWPGLGDYYMSSMLSGTIENNERVMLWDHFKHFVYGRGICPSIRIGKQPYGILPARSQNRWSESEDDWTNNESNNPNSDVFYKKLHLIIKELYEKYWVAMSASEKVPSIGNNVDTDEELTSILAMSPHSLSYHSRAFVDDRFVSFLLNALGPYFFGENSGFDTASPEAIEYWTSAWAEKWERCENPPDQVLKDIAVSIGLDDDSLVGPALSNLFSWGNGRNINTSLVLEENTDQPISYLNEFTDLLENLPNANADKPILYELIRRSLAYQRSYEDGKCLIPPASEIHSITYPSYGRIIEILIEVGDYFNKDDVIAKVLLGPLPGSDQPFIKDITAPEGGRVVEIVYNPSAPAAIPQIFVILRYETSKLAEERICKSVRELVSAGIKESVLEGQVTDALDLLTHRLDAWVTSLANRRILAMRRRSPEGLHIGAYGYVENLSKDDQLSGDIAQGNPGGYIHAPSMGQAATAALLRNAYLTHQDDPDGNAYRINLESQRVRHAMRTMQGLREGQELPELLGYLLERELHEINLDFLIDEFRSLYPLVAEKEVPIDSNSESDEAIEAIAARNVADGLAVARDFDDLNQWEKVLNKLDGLLEDDLEATLNEYYDNPDEKRIELLGALDNLCDTLDAINDTLIHESVYQVVQGNHDRGGAALEAMNGVNRPPELESIKTPNAAVNYGQRVVMLFEPAPELTEVDNKYPKRCAEPRLDKWVQDILGPFDQIGCIVNLIGESDDVPVTLSDLDLCALDLLSITADETSKSETDLDRNIKFFIQVHHNQNVESINYHFRSEDHPRSMAEALELLRTIRKVISVEKKYLTPCSLSRPEGQADANGKDTYIEDLFSDRDFEDLQARVGKVVDSFEQAIRNLGAATEIEYELYANLGRFKTLEALPSELPDNEEEFIELKSSILKQAETILSKANLAFAELNSFRESGTDINGAIHKLCEITRIYLGENFVMLPIFSPTNGVELAPAFSDSLELINDDPENVNLWLQQAAEVKPRLQQFEDMLLATSAWQTIEVNEDTGITDELNDIENHHQYEFHVAQLPQNICRKWIALPDADHDFTGLEERPRSITSFACYTGKNTNTILQANDYSDTRICGLLIDAWDEKIPQFGQETEPGIREVLTQQTGISFQYDRPNAQAPQAILIAVPGAVKDEDDWQPESLRDIVCETMDLAKIRAVDLDAFSNIGGIVPGLYLPVDENTPGWMRDVVMDSLEDLIVKPSPCANLHSYVAGTGLGPKFDDMGMELISLGSGPALVPKHHDRYAANHEGIQITWNSEARGELIITISQISGLNSEPIPEIYAYDASNNLVASGFGERYNLIRRFRIDLDFAARIEMIGGYHSPSLNYRYYFNSICVIEPEPPAPIEVGSIFNGFLVKDIIPRGAHDGYYTFRVYNRTEGKVYMYYNGTEMMYVNYDWKTTISFDQPHRFSFNGYFDIDIGRSAGSSNLYGIKNSVFDGQKTLHIE